MTHINTVTGKIHHENKYCVILGDFNLGLFKFESHPGTNDFFKHLCFIIFPAPNFATNQDY